MQKFLLESAQAGGSCAASRPLPAPALAAAPREPTTAGIA
jgi:hypothetical protein